MDKYDYLFEQIDWKTLLLDNYRNLNLSEEEVMVILVSDYCNKQGEKVITPELLSLKMTYTPQKISEILTQLMNKSLLFLEDVDGKLVTSLRGIKRILVDDFLRLQNKNEEKSEDNIKTEKNLYTTFENEFGRPLSFAEIETMKSWLDDGYTEQMIMLALREAIANKAKNLRYIDKILLEWRQQNERKQEGYTTISDGWRKDMKESIEIANLDWVEKKNAKEDK